MFKRNFPVFFVLILVFIVMTIASVHSQGTKLAISKLEVEVDGRDVTVNNGDSISKEAEPGSKVSFDIEIENLYTREEDINIEDVEIMVTILDIDGGDLEDDANEFDLASGRTKSRKVSFTIPYEVDEGEYTVIIMVKGEDERGTEHELFWDLILEVEKDKHVLKILEADINPGILECNTSSTLSVSVINAGEKDEDDAEIRISNRELGIDIFDEFSLDEGESEIYNQKYTIQADTELIKTFLIHIEALADGAVLDEKDIPLRVNECHGLPQLPRRTIVTRSSIIEIIVLPQIEPVIYPKKETCFAFWCW